MEFAISEEVEIQPINWSLPKCDGIVKHLRKELKHNYKALHVNAQWLQTYELVETYGLSNIVVQNVLPGACIYALRHGTPDAPWLGNACVHDAPHDDYGLWARNKTRIFTEDLSDVDAVVRLERSIYDLMPIDINYISFGGHSIDLISNALFGLRIARTMVIEFPKTWRSPELWLINLLVRYSKVRITIILGSIFIVCTDINISPGHLRQAYELLHAQVDGHFVHRASGSGISLTHIVEQVKSHTYDFLEEESWLLKMGIRPRK